MAIFSFAAHSRFVMSSSIYEARPGRLHQLEIGGDIVLEELVEFRNGHRQLLDADLGQPLTVIEHFGKGAALAGTNPSALKCCTG